MDCEICGRGNCTRSFHSLEAQEEFDNVVDNIKENARNVITNRVNRIDGHYHGDNYYVKLDAVIKVIEDYY